MRPLAGRLSLDSRKQIREPAQTLRLVLRPHVHPDVHDATDVDVSRKHEQGELNEFVLLAHPDHDGGAEAAMMSKEHFIETYGEPHFTLSAGASGGSYGSFQLADALPGVVAATKGKIPVLMDSGIRCGADVFKALALGARAVGIGRPYVYGLADIVATQRRPTYMFVHFYPTGQWFYFPLAFMVKTSISLLVLLAVGLLTYRLYREHRREILFLLLPPLIYFAVSLLSGINIGVRHLLPIYPFLIVTAAGGIYLWSQKYLAVKHILVGLVLFHAATAARTAPATPGRCRTRA